MRGVYGWLRQAQAGRYWQAGTGWSWQAGAGGSRRAAGAKARAKAAGTGRPLLPLPPPRRPAPPPAQVEGFWRPALASALALAEGRWLAAKAFGRQQWAN